jgi:hypothetical protein
MRKFFSISVVLMLISVGIALAQTPTVLSTKERMQKIMAGPQCTTSDKTYGPGAVTQHEGMSFRCAHVYDEWLTRTTRVVWVKE